MKNSLLLVIFFFLTIALSAQQEKPKRLVIQFTDKGISPDAPVNPSLYLSGKSIERRLKFNIAFDHSDLPVYERYVNEIAGMGAKILTRSRWFNTIVVDAPQTVAGQLADLKFVSGIKQIDNEVYSSSSEKPFFAGEKVSPWTEPLPKQSANDYYNYGAAYNQINQLSGQYLHNNGFRGQGMTIAVIDAGFNSVDIMSCFDSLRMNNQIKGTRDFAVPGNNVYATSMNSHGTSVLSCMGANVSGQMVGTAPKADYWLLRSEVAGPESLIEEYYWVSAAEFADSVGVDLINSSLGYTTFDNPAENHTYADMDGNTTVVTRGADKAAEKGILVVNSAGNEGGSGWRYIGAPADGDSVFTAGAVDSDGYRASFSSVGPTTDGRLKPTVAARGVNAAIYYPGGFGGGSGTSFSSPILCGITACLWQALPQLNNMQIIEEIKITSSQALNPDSLLGWGIPNFQMAYTTLSVNKKAANTSLVVFPNPVKDRCTVTLPLMLKGKFDIEIINMQGQIVYTQNQNTASMSLQINDIGFLIPGIYVLRISNGKTSYIERMIKS